MEFEITRIFVKVVQHGSFTKAAEALKLPKSTVSKAVRRLEEDTATKLLLRTTRSLTLTAAGRAYYEACAPSVQQLEDARKSLSGADSIMQGRIRITAPEDLGGYVIAPVVADLSRRHSGLSFELRYTDQVVDLVRDGFDLAVRIGRLAPSNFKTLRLGEVTLIPVAAKSYLTQRPALNHPRDLQSHDALSFSESGLRETWALRSRSETAKVRVNARISSNQMTSLVRMAIAGAGVALIPSYLVTEDLRAKRLVRVLPEWSAPGMPVTLISTLPPASAARLRLTVDHLAVRLRELLSPAGSRA